MSKKHDSHTREFARRKIDMTVSLGLFRQRMDSFVYLENQGQQPFLALADPISGRNEGPFCLPIFGQTTAHFVNSRLIHSFLQEIFPFQAPCKVYVAGKGRQQVRLSIDNFQTAV